MASDDNPREYSKQGRPGRPVRRSEFAPPRASVPPQPVPEQPPKSTGDIEGLVAQMKWLVAEVADARHKPPSGTISSKDVAAEIAKRNAIERKESRTFWLKIVAAALGTVTTIVGGYLGLRPEQVKPITTDEVQATVEEEAEALAEQVRQNTEEQKATRARQRALAGEIIRIGDEAAEADEAIIDKLDAISPRARKVDTPTSVKRRKAKKAQAKMDERVDALFEDAEGEL